MANAQTQQKRFHVVPSEENYQSETLLSSANVSDNSNSDGEGA